MSGSWGASPVVCDEMTTTAVLFDLDDTLYLERDFFLGGFEAVAGELHCRGVDGPEPLAEQLLLLHLEQRDGVFDRAASLMGFPKEWVADLVSLFRLHEPVIELSAEVPAVLRSLQERSIRLGVVTDGIADVQRRKVASLGIRSFVDSIVIADDFGRDRWKPDPYAFRRCVQELQATPETVLVVGDHPDRDMRGARNAGLTSVRIRRPGGYFSDRQTQDVRADHEIVDLRQLIDIVRGG